MTIAKSAGPAGLFVAITSAAVAQPAPGDFVYLRDLDASIQQDIRYAGANNFVGRPLAGYEAAECVVKRYVGLALMRVQRDLAPRGLSLKMLDCYRPERAVRDMVAWAKDGYETAAQHRYNPGFSKADLFRLGYSATHSKHSTGVAVDLTLVNRRAAPDRTFDPRRAYADCTAAATLRAPEASVDMGTGYDCSAEKAHTASNNISASQRRWRDILLSAMAKQGFANFRLEWWHFSMPGSGGTARDFPIVRR